MSEIINYDALCAQLATAPLDAIPFTHHTPTPSPHFPDASTEPYERLIVTFPHSAIEMKRHPTPEGMRYDLWGASGIKREGDSYLLGFGNGATLYTVMLTALGIEKDDLLLAKQESRLREKLGNLDAATAVAVLNAVSSKFFVNAPDYAARINEENRARNAGKSGGLAQ